MNKIPLFKPYLNKQLILDKIGDVLDSYWISGGSEIDRFENALKEYNQDTNGHYISVSNATDGLEMALMVMNKGNRYDWTDEIIVPSWSWVASAFVVSRVGATPVWVDVNEYGVVDAQEIEQRITDNTKAIIVVHQMGIPCDLDAINAIGRKYDIPILEDTACGFGSEYKGIKLGNTENISVYSHQAKKVLTTGEGGTISTKNAHTANWLRSYRVFGSNSTPYQREHQQSFRIEEFDKLGSNFKISDILCAVGLAQLETIDDEIIHRDIVGRYYNDTILDLKNIGYDIDIGNKIPEYCTRYNWQNFHVILGEQYNRNDIMLKLREHGIMAKWDIQPIHREPYYSSYCELPNTDKFATQGLLLPFYPGLKLREVDYIIDKLIELL